MKFLSKFSAAVWRLLAPSARARFVVVELAALPLVDPESEAAVVTLGLHPGFRALMARFGVQRALLESRLKNTRHDSMRDVEFLQSGIQWLNWLDRQVRQATQRAAEQRTAREPYEPEQRAFDEISKALTLVGTKEG